MTIKIPKTKKKTNWLREGIELLDRNRVISVRKGEGTEMTR